MNNIIAIKTAEGEFIGEEVLSSSRIVNLNNCYRLNIIDNMRGELTVSFRPAVHHELVDLNKNNSMHLKFSMASVVYSYIPSKKIIELYTDAINGKPTHKFGPSGL